MNRAPAAAVGGVPRGRLEGVGETFGSELAKQVATLVGSAVRKIPTVVTRSPPDENGASAAIERHLTYAASWSETYVSFEKPRASSVDDESIDLSYCNVPRKFRGNADPTIHY